MKHCERIAPSYLFPFFRHILIRPVVVVVVVQLLVIYDRSGSSTCLVGNDDKNRMMDGPWTRLFGGRLVCSRSSSG